MRIGIQAKLALLLAIAAVSMPSAARAQGKPAVDSPRVELAIDYSYLHSNAPPAGCGCFSMNGGSATIAVPIKSSAFALSGDLTAVHGVNISSAGYDLTLTAYTVGVRYKRAVGQSAWSPFGHALVGGVHDSGSLTQVESGSGSSGTNAFAANLGGGLDLRLNHRFSIRLIEADYLLTTFNNQSNNRQNNARISAGAVIRFGK